MRYETKGMALGIFSKYEALCYLNSTGDLSHVGSAVNFEKLSSRPGLFFFFCYSSLTLENKATNLHKVSLG